MMVVAFIVAYLLVAFVTEYVAGLMGRELMGLGFLWPVSIPFGLIFIGLEWIGERGREDYWRS